MPMAGSCPPRAPTGPPQEAPQSLMRPDHRMRRRPLGSTAPPAAGEAKAGPPQATQAKDDTGVDDPRMIRALTTQITLEPRHRRFLAAGSRRASRSAAGGATGDGEAVEVSWPRGGLEVADVHWFAAGGAGRDGCGDLAAGAVPDEDWRAVWRGVLVAPLPHAGQHRPQVTAFAGEAVVVARRVLAVGHFHQDAGVHQLGQALVEHVARDAEPVLELVEAANSEEGVPQDQHRPPFAGDLQALRDRAVHGGEALVFHVPYISQLHDRTRLFYCRSYDRTHCKPGASDRGIDRPGHRGQPWPGCRLRPRAP